jgi:hypothetical protein
VIVVVLIVMAGGYLLLREPSVSTVRVTALLFLVFGALLVVQVFLARLFLAIYRRALRGSRLVGWAMLILAVVMVMMSIADIAWRASKLASVRPIPGGELLKAAQNLWPIYIAMALAYAGWGLVRIAGSQYRQLLQIPGRLERRFKFSEMMGIPLWSRASRSQRKAIRLAWVAFLCEGVAFAAYFFYGSAGDAPALPLGGAVAIVVVAWPLSVGFLYGVLALADWLWDRSRLAGQLTLQEALLLDQRAPILFLRSFQDDQVSLKAAKLPTYLRALDPGLVAHRFEELLVQDLSYVGPVVAIGNPRDFQRPIGASREYLDNRDWHDEVLQYMKQSRAIVVSLSETHGLEWELTQISCHGYLMKTLFVVPPGLSSRFDVARNGAALAGLQLDATYELSARSRRGKYTSQHLVACWGDGTDTSTAVCSEQLCELDYQLALRLFVVTRDHVAIS